MKNSSSPSSGQPERLFGTMTKSQSCPRAFSELLDEFEREASKLAFQILFHLLRHHDYRCPLPSQSAIAEKLEVSQAHVSRSFVELTKYKLIFRCLVKELKVRDKVEYFLNPQLFWDRSEAERQERINWILHVVAPKQKKPALRKKPASQPKNVIKFQSPSLRKRGQGA
jgi:DNA-binding MarR family transcriptional regulator